MGALLLHNQWIQFYLVYLGTLVSVLIYATTRRPESKRKTSSVRIKAAAADTSRSEAA